MSMLRVISYLILLLFILPSVFSIMVVESSGFSDNFVYYTNNDDPTITVNLVNPTGEVTVHGASLTQADNVSYAEKDLFLGPDESGQINFSLQDFEQFDILNESLTYFFSLNVTRTQGFFGSGSDPTNFYIKLDQTMPEYLSANSTNVGPFELEFSKRMSRVLIVYGETVIMDRTGPSSRRVSDFADTFSIDFSEFNLFEELGVYDLSITGIDLAGNQIQTNLKLNQIGPPLTLSLLDREDDSSLNYKYIKNSMYENTIYVSNENTLVKLETNKDAQCLYKDNYISHSPSYSNNRRDTQEFSSTDGLEHSATLSTGKYWIGCHMSGNEEDNDQLFNHMMNSPGIIEIKRFTGDINPSIVYPVSLSTSSSFTIEVNTAEKATCTYSAGSSSGNLEPSSGFKKHQKSIDLPNNEYTLQVTCTDVLGESKSVSRTFEVDDTKGVQITMDSLFYSGSNTLTVPFILSGEVQSCRVGERGIQISDMEIYDAIPIEANTSSVNGEVIISGLARGENNYSIYCLDVAGDTKSKDFSIIMDTNSPLINSVFFMNDNDIESSSYIGEEDEFTLLINYTSLIPVDRVIITSEDLDLNINRSVSSSSGILSDFRVRVSEDMEHNTQHTFQLQLQSILGKVSQTQTKTFTVDLEQPVLSINVEDGRATIICSDPVSGCEWIKYSLASTPLDRSCTNPNKLYNSTPVLVDSSGYICAVSVDGAGLMSEPELLEVESQNQDNNRTVGPPPPPISRPTNDLCGSNDDFFEFGVTQWPSDGTFCLEGGTLEGEEPSFPSPGEEVTWNCVNDSNETQGPTCSASALEEDEEEPIEIVDPNLPPEEEESNWLLIVLAAVLLVGGLSGGGYYAYRKGYLDKQLQKMGIAPSTSRKKGDQGSLGSMKPSQPPLTSSGVKSTYDKHMKKLHNFLDRSIDKKNKVFDSFKSPEKGKVDGYEDTLMKGHVVSKEDVEEFDDFYNKSGKSKTGLEKKASLEDEAEKFEEYYKEKKKSNKKDTKPKK